MCKQKCEHQGQLHRVICLTGPDPESMRLEEAECLSRDKGFLLRVPAGCPRHRYASKRACRDILFSVVKQNNFSVHLLIPLSFLVQGRWSHK